MIGNELPISRSVTAQAAAGQMVYALGTRWKETSIKAPCPSPPSPVSQSQQVSPDLPFPRKALNQQEVADESDPPQPPKSLQCDPQIFKHHLHKVSGRNLIKTANVHSFFLLRISPF